MRIKCKSLSVVNNMYLDSLQNFQAWTNQKTAIFVLANQTALYCSLCPAVQV